MNLKTRVWRIIRSYPGIASSELCLILAKVEPHKLGEAVVALIDAGKIREPNAGERAARGWEPEDERWVPVAWSSLERHPDVIGED